MSVRKSINDDTARKPVDGKNFTTALPAKRSEKVKGARIQVWRKDWSDNSLNLLPNQSWRSHAGLLSQFTVKLLQFQHLTTELKILSENLFSKKSASD